MGRREFGVGGLGLNLGFVVGEVGLNPKSGFHLVGGGGLNPISGVGVLGLNLGFIFFGGGLEGKIHKIWVFWD